MALLDTIQKNMASPQTAAGAGVGVGDSTALATQVLRGKAGRDVGTSSSPRSSNIGELVAADRGRIGLEQTMQQGQLASKELAQRGNILEKQELVQEKQLSEQRLRVVEQYQNQAMQILGDLERKGLELQSHKDRARFEQAGFAIRLSTEQYIEKLEREGAMSRLDDEAAFREELARTIFSEEMDLFANDMVFRSMMSADDRQFTEELAAIDINQALQIASTQAQQANQTAMWTGFGEAAKAGISGWNSSASKATTDKSTIEASDAEVDTDDDEEF